MHYDKEKLEGVIRYFTIAPRDNKAYAILINGYRFRGSSGKTGWIEIVELK